MNSCTKDGHSGKCSSTCKCVLDPYCGDQVVGTGEECDPPNNPCTKDGHSGKCSSHVSVCLILTVEIK
jgi:hypothetical protein